MNLSSGPIGRRSGSFLTAIALAGSLVAACSSPTSSPTTSSNPQGSTITIAHISGTLANPWFGAEKRGVDQASKDVGVTAQFVATDVTGPGMAQAIDAAIASKVSAIAVHNWYPSAEEPELKKAVAAGIPVIVVDAAGDWQGIGAIGFIGQTDFDAGQEGAKRLAAAGVKHLLFVNHAPGAVNLESRYKAVIQTMQPLGVKVSNLNISFSSSTTASQVTSAIQGALVADPSIDGVFTMGASIAEDAAGAIDNTGRTDKIKLGTTDLSTGDLNLVKQGKLLFALDSQPYLIGYYAITILTQAVRFGMHTVGQVSTGPIAITKDNIDLVLSSNTANPGIRGAA